MKKDNLPDVIGNFLQETQASREQAISKLDDIRRRIASGASEENEKLRMILGAAKEKLQEQNEVLEQLTAAPFVHATVLYIDTVGKTSIPFSLDRLKKGAKVRVVDERDHHYHGQVGEIVKEIDGDGDVNVRFEDGDTHYICVLDKHEDERQVEPLEGSPDDSDSYAEGKKVKILRGRYEDQIGTITSGLDDDGDIEVRFKDDDEETFYVKRFFGPPLEIISDGEALISVVVAHEGKRIELRYPEEMLQRLGRSNLHASDTHGDSGSSEFPTGARVKIKKDSKFSHQNEGEGTVVGRGDIRGWVAVSFDDGYSNHYRTGNPPSQGGGVDLEVVSLPFTRESREDFDPVYPIRPGDIVKLNLQTLQIVEVAKPVHSGEVSIVRRIVDEITSEVDHQGTPRVVLNGTLSGKPEVGDRVLLDASASVIVRNLGKEDERFSFTMETNVSWEDIGGLLEAKQQMIEAVELPFRHPEIYKYYGKKPIKGVLLYGPPGCGKTMLGKATATALAAIHNGHSVSSGFIYIKGPEILDRYVGVAEATIRQIFQRSRKQRELHGYPSVIFIDEADAILGKRGMGISSDIERTIVPMFLAEMDGLEDSGAVVLLATNRPDILDPAVVRDGRVDRQVRISRPDPDSARSIFEIYLKNMPLSNGYSVEQLADLATKELFAEKRALYAIHLNGDRKGQVIKFTLGNLSSGAMIAGIVDQASSIALQKDLRENTTTGVSTENILCAVDQVQNEVIDLNHADDLAEFVRDFREDVVSIQKLRQGIA